MGAGRRSPMPSRLSSWSGPVKGRGFRKPSPRSPPRRSGSTSTPTTCPTPTSLSGRAASSACPAFSSGSRPTASSTSATPTGPPSGRLTCSGRSGPTSSASAASARSRGHRPRPVTPPPPMDKKQVAAVLEEIAALLELQGENPFKSRAYLAAARAIEAAGQEPPDLVETGALKNLKGIGEALAEKITELGRTGRTCEHAEKRDKISPGP